ncbi:major facilitator superfamily transporter [Ceratobasidium sp. AG-Ba]|nr:major facilitator superfamily transporter [Ceratobasidium sp. AG-Ba]
MNVSSTSRRFDPEEQISSEAPSLSGNEKDLNKPSSGSTPPTAVQWQRTVSLQTVVDERAKYPGSGTIEDPYIVDWVSEDTENPHNWTGFKRWTITGIVAVSTLCVSFASSSYSGGIQYMMADLHMGQYVAILGISLYVVGFGLGPLLWGPLSEMYGRRLIFLVSFLPFVFLHIFAPVLLRRRARYLHAESEGKVHYISKFEKGNKKTFGEIMKINLSRPFVLLFKEPIVLLFAIYAALVYGTLYGLFAAFPVVFQRGRHFTPGEGGLAFLGIGLGIVIATCLTPINNKIYYRAIEKGNGVAPPEARLVMCCVGAVLLPISMTWFAWTTYPSIHYIVPIIAGIPFGVGMMLVFTSIISYLIDSYTLYAASALAANAVLRSAMGAAFPLFTPKMYASLGDQWACMVFAFLALVCTPIPFLFYRYGPAIRARSKFSVSPPTLTGNPVPEIIERELEREAEVEAEKRHANARSAA